jgi:hypothetical protein
MECSYCRKELPRRQRLLIRRCVRMKKTIDGRDAMVTCQSRWIDYVQRLMSPLDADEIEWTRPERIIAELSRLGLEVPGVTWAFLPCGGGLEIARAALSSEPECIQLEGNDGELYVCRPRSLRCNAVPGATSHSFFDLRLERLRPLDEEIVRDDMKEEWRGKVLASDGTETVADYTRLLGGWILICCSVSYDDDLDGQYDEMTRNQFRRVMRHLAVNGYDASDLDVGA